MDRPGKYSQTRYPRPDMASYTEIRTDDDPEPDPAQPSTSTGSFRKKRSDLDAKPSDVSFDVTMETRVDDTDSVSLQHDETLPRRSRQNSHRHSNHVSEKSADTTKDTKDPDAEPDVDAEERSREFEFCVKMPIPEGPIIDLRGREVLFAIGVFFFLSVSIGLMVVLASDRLKSQQQQQAPVKEDPSGPAKEGPTDLCLTKECMSRAAAMLDMMDQGADPCVDFWTYSCGGWLAKHEIPPSEGSWGVDKVLEQNMERHINVIMNSDIHDTRQESAERKMKTFFRQCTDLEATESDGVRPLLDEIDLMGGWAVFDDWNMPSKPGRWNFQTVLKELHHKYLVTVFFSPLVTPDDMLGGNVLQLDQSFLPYYDIYDPYRPELADAYQLYMEQTVRLFGVNEADIREFVDKTWEFEKKLAQIHVSEYDESRANPYENYNQITISQLQEIAPRISWLEYINDAFPEMTESSQILITNEDFFRSFSQLLDDTNEKTMNYYMMWRLVDDSMAFLPSDFRSKHRQFMTAYQGRPETQSREQYCVEKTNHAFHFEVAASFANEYFPPTNKNDVTHIVEHLRQQLVESLQKSNWLDTDTREEAIKKANSMAIHIAYPDFITSQEEVNRYYNEFSVNADDTFFQTILNSYKHEMSLTKQMLAGTIMGESWDMPIHEANAYNNPVHNSIVFPMGLFQRPHYEAHVPQYINYGGVGSVIGHEMNHAFNGIGAMYDADGAMRLWWGPQSSMTLHQKMQCVANYTSSKSYNGHKLDGELSSNEHIADIEGLKLAYQAYRRSRSDQEQQMPGLYLTNDQAFFLSFAQGYCKKRREELIPAYLNNSVYVIESLRVTGTLAQVPEFAASFSCPLASPMNPTHRCDLWAD